jgi:RHS repeat-associated protein
MKTNYQGLLSVTHRTPNYYRQPSRDSDHDWGNLRHKDHAYTVSRHNGDLQGFLTSVFTPDEGHIYTIRDHAGRVRFELDHAALIDEHLQFDGYEPNKPAAEITIKPAPLITVKYYHYDRVGRVVESGLYSTKCDLHKLQMEANVKVWAPPPKGTEGSEGKECIEWQKRYFYDKDDNGQSENLKNRLYKMQHKQGDKIIENRYAYDQQGRVISVTLEIISEGQIISSKTITYGYNQAGQTTRIGYPDGSEVVYTYNSLGQLDSIGTTQDRNLYAMYTYDIYGRMRYVNSGYCFRMAFEIRNDYDLQGHLREISSSVGVDGPSFKQELSYIDNSDRYQDGNVVQMTLTKGSNRVERRSYIYDGLQRLINSTTEDAPSNRAVLIDYVYDHNGNIKGVSSYYDDANIREFNTYTFGTNQIDTIKEGWHKEGKYEELAETTLTYDRNGNVQTKQVQAQEDNANKKLTFSYDRLTQMPTYIKIEGARDGSVDFRYSVDFMYDADNRRVMKSLSGYTTLYVHGQNALPLVEERKGEGREEITSIYIHGPDGLIAQKEADKIYFVFKDYQGSTQLIIDEQGQQQTPYIIYSPFGQIEPDSWWTKNYMNRFRYLYTGQEYDVGTDLYNYRARLYDPQLRRFLSPDPRHEGASPYVYVGDNPVNRVDPTGAIFEGIRNWFRGMRTRIGRLFGRVEGESVLGAGVGDNLGAGVDDNLGAGVGDNLGAGVGDNLGAGVGDDIGAGVAGAEVEFPPFDPQKQGRIQRNPRHGAHPVIDELGNEYHPHGKYPRRPDPIATPNCSPRHPNLIKSNRMREQYRRMTTEQRDELKNVFDAISRQTNAYHPHQVRRYWYRDATFLTAGEASNNARGIWRVQYNQEDVNYRIRGIYNYHNNAHEWW